MEIRFSRSGGLFPGTGVEGKVIFTERGGEVTSAAGYHRPLAPNEVSRLLAWQRAPGATNAGPGELRDGFQYDLWTESAHTTGHGAVEDDWLAWVEPNASVSGRTS